MPNSGHLAKTTTKERDRDAREWMPIVYRSPNARQKVAVKIPRGQELTVGRKSHHHDRAGMAKKRIALMPAAGHSAVVDFDQCGHHRYQRDSAPEKH
jgi:hypothetical protein